MHKLEAKCEIPSIEIYAPSIKCSSLPQKFLFKLTMEDERKEILLYIDNSNLFITTKQYAGADQRFLNGMEDSRCRVNVKEMKSTLSEDRTIITAKLFGSEPPNLHNLQREMRKHNLEVFIVEQEKKKGKGVEKEVDVALAVEACKDIILKRNQNRRQVFVLVSGDGDFKPVAEIARDYGWEVEIWAYTNSKTMKWNKMSQDDQEGLVTVRNLDNVFKGITYTEYDWEGKIPRGRSFVIRFGQRNLPLNEKDLLRKVVETSSKVFRLPMQGRFGPGPDFDLFTVCCLHQDTFYYDPTTETNKKYYNFNGDIWSKIEMMKKELDFTESVEVLTAMDYFQQISKMALEQGCSNRFDLLDEDTRPSDDFEDEWEGSSYDSSRFKIKQRKHGEGYRSTDSLSKPVKQYSGPCPYEFRCKKGRKCERQHTAKHDKFFGVQPKIRKRKMYKLEGNS